MFIPADTINGLPHLIYRDMVRESISNMQNGKAAELSGLVSEIVKAAGETEVDIIIALKSDCS